MKTLACALAATSMSFAGCSCSDPLTVGALPEDGSASDATGAGTSDAAPVTRPCGVSERRFSVVLSSGEEFPRPTAIGGHGDTLFAAQRTGDAETGFTLTLFEIDVDSEAVREIGSVGIPDLYPWTVWVDARTVEVYVTAIGSLGVVRFDRETGDAQVAMHAITDGLRVHQTVGVPGGFVGVGDVRLVPHLVHITLSELRAIRLDGATALQTIAWDPYAGVVRLLDTTLEPAPVLRAATLDLADLGAPPTWATVFSGGDGDGLITATVSGLPGRWVTALFHQERISDAPAYGPSRLRLIWRNDTGVLHEWEGADGLNAHTLRIVGTADRQALVGMFTTPESGLRMETWTYGEIDPDGNVRSLRALREDAYGGPTAWVTGRGGIASAVALRRIDVFVTCEDTP